jgi:hypothetical protein
MNPLCRIAANHIFKTEAELFDFIENKRRPIFKPKYAKFQQAFGKWQGSIIRRKKKEGK